MNGQGTIHVGFDAQLRRSFLRSGSGDPPFSIRQCGGRIMISSSAAAPVGGDELSLDIVVDDDARADVVAALPRPLGFSPRR